MKITENVTAVTPELPKHRLYVGWCILIGLTLLELLAVLYGKPSALQPYPFISAFVRAVGEWVPVVQSFGRCAAQVDAGTGLMLALNATFFPFKLAAVYFAHPKKLTNPDQGWRAVWGMFYMFLIAVVALVPVLMFYVGWGNAGEPSDLLSVRRKFSALCAGGPQAFIAAQIQSGFALLCAFTSVVIFVGLARSLSKLLQSKS